MSNESIGKVITFYSYKGGSSRSMALANIAWILASNGKRVLTVDWDLEAPGLHRYFAPFLLDKELTSSRGIIDLVWDFVNEATKPLESENNSTTTDHEKDWYQPLTNIKPFAIRLNWIFPNGGALDFIPAGRQGSSYAKRVNFFNWENFYNRFGGGVFLEAVKQEMQKNYDYILIDSRTGVSDTSGICTVQLPDILVLIFTPNNQNVEGAYSVAESVSKQWGAQQNLQDKRLIYPVLTRTERAELDKLDLARRYIKVKFQDFLSNMSSKEQEDYWANVEIPYVTWYAYEEVLATFRDQPNTRDSLLAAYQQLTRFLTNNEISVLVPPEPLLREEVLIKFTRMKDSLSEEVAKATRRMEAKLTELDKLSEAVKLKQNNLVTLNAGWFYGHHYGDLATFTGRVDELKMLDNWLASNDETLLMLRALGGFGKSALAWTWFNRVDRAQWGTAIWWSFYEKESGFETFLSETLKHLGVEVKLSARQQVNDLLEAMRGRNILIVLDGFERLLRQYGQMDAALVSDDEDANIDPSQRDCSSPLTEIFLRGLFRGETHSKVLMTTRLAPRVLESTDGKLLKGCRDELLSTFSPEDAVTYFHNEGIVGTQEEILAVCSAYGYHPLSLSLLVGLINEDHEHRGDIAAVKNLEIFENINARRHHVLERAYESLAPERRDLLSKISCFRGSVEYAVLKKVFPSPDLDKALFDLFQRGLLLYAGETQQYDMLPIVRHYAYDHFTDEKRRKEAHVQLAMHFIDSMPVTNRNVKTLEDLAPVIELYHHLVRAENLDEAFRLFYDRINTPAYYQFGAYQLQIELLRALFIDGEDAPPRLKRDDYQAWTLNSLANSYSLSGQPRRAVPVLQNAVLLAEKMGNKKNVAIALGNATDDQLKIGALSAAEHNLRLQINLCLDIADEFNEAVGHQELGRVLSYCGVWQEAEQEYSKSLEITEKILHVQNQGLTWSYRALRFLLMAREKAIFDTRKSKSDTQQVVLDIRYSKNEPRIISNIEYQVSAIESAKRALELADKYTRTDVPSPRDYVRVYWLLGAAYRMNNELALAEEDLSKALDLCRQINLVDAEADILLDIARLRYAQGDFQDSQEKIYEALTITERSKYVLQGADVHLLLAELALAGEGRSEKGEGGKELALEHAKAALKLATCDGPPYYYKVAYEEAERMIEKLTVVE